MDNWEDPKTALGKSESSLYQTMEPWVKKCFEHNITNRAFNKRSLIIFLASVRK